MEHLQRLYWSQYRGDILQLFEVAVGKLSSILTPTQVLQTIRHGRPEQAIEVCLDLLLEPQLNLYLRVLVNATIAEYASFEQHPDKADFAEEAIRVSREMEEATEGEGPRAQATVQRAIFLANRSLDVVIQQTAERHSRLANDVLSQELPISQTAASLQETDTVRDIARIPGAASPRIAASLPTTTSVLAASSPRIAASQAGEDSDISMRSSPPPYDEQRTPRATESQFPLRSSDDAEDPMARDTGMQLDPEDHTSTPKPFGFGLDSGSDDDKMASDSDIELPPPPPTSQNLTLLQKSRLPTPETSDAPQPPSSDM